MNVVAAGIDYKKLYNMIPQPCIIESVNLLKCQNKYRIKK